MKKINFILLVAILGMLTSCGIGVYYPYAHNVFGAQTTVHLDKANFRVVRDVEAVVAVTNTNLSRSSVEKSAYGQLLRNARLTGSQVLINVVIEEVQRASGGLFRWAFRAPKIVQYVAARATIIEFLDENGNPTEVNFDDLTDDEKFDILNYQEDPVLPSDDEIQMLNYLRQNNMSLQDFAVWQRQQAIDEYLANQRPVSDIDTYSDEEIVAYDFIQRFGDDMSDEEIDEEIERLKANPEAFEKRVALLRNAFKSEEEAQAKLYQDQEADRNAENEQMFINSYAQAMGNIDSIQNIELDNNDRDELLRFVLEKDQANRTGLSKAMDNPENVLKMAWYLLHGEETVDAMIDYFKKEIDKRSKTGPRVVTKAPQSSKPTKRATSDSFVF